MTTNTTIRVRLVLNNIETSFVSIKKKTRLMEKYTWTVIQWVSCTEGRSRLYNSRAVRHYNPDNGSSRARTTEKWVNRLLPDYVALFFRVKTLIIEVSKKKINTMKKINQRVGDMCHDGSRGQGTMSADIVDNFSLVYRYFRNAANNTFRTLKKSKL